ncbi:hypothetical protein TIFTF001_014245 [Ficus carica]|uniref:Uncharacterized protein n=1 Tax=Ficus carica TaxID=3494 RepID=A0AA88D7Z9_FICCA|nr:hypothetical protein TIFTF001_014245 [Ficus carica]
MISPSRSLAGGASQSGSRYWQRQAMLLPLVLDNNGGSSRNVCWRWKINLEKVTVRRWRPPPRLATKEFKDSDE